MVRRPEEYPWSSAPAHVAGGDGTGPLDMEWWRRAKRTDWREILNARILEPEAQGAVHNDSFKALCACTYAGSPFGSETFVSEMGKRFNRHWIRGRPKEKAAPTLAQRKLQLPLF